jgi:Tfp pilus assembly protein PilN
MAIVAGVVPSDVFITTVDDDGRVVALEAEADDFAKLLAYIRLLEDVPQFVHVQVLSMGLVNEADSGAPTEPVEQAGGPVVV